MAEVGPDIAERFTGQRRVTSIAAAVAELEKAKAGLRHAQSTRRLRLIALIPPNIAARFFISWRWLATLPMRRAWPRMAIMFGLCLALATVSMPLAILFFPWNIPVIVACYVLSFLCILLQPVVLPEDTSRAERLHAFWSERIREGSDRLRAADEELWSCHRRQADALRLHEGIRRAADARLLRLLSADFRAMSGDEFEAFLAEVFEWLGYTVRRTGKAGDQGVDLIAAKGGTDIAVQAKCYGDAVSNAAVQQVFTGMRVHRCQRCAVITSSRFTNGAREAAGTVRRALVEGEEIRQLICGEIVL